MAKKSISKRIKITKTGKIKRRPMGLGHSRSNKNRRQVMRKKGERTLDIPAGVANKNLR